jgi:hypothetical protein
VILKKIALLGLLSTFSALSFNSAAQAAIFWDWSFGGTESVRFTTDGNIGDLDSAGTFNITDFQVLASSVPSLVGADFINDPNTVAQGGQGFLWDGSQITQVFRDNGNLTNGANFVSGNFLYSFDTGASLFEDTTDPANTTIFETAFNPTPSAPPTASTPEPDSVLALVGLGFGALAVKGKKRA